MARVYLRKGERRRNEAITALFTAEEKQRVIDAATKLNIPLSIFIHQTILSHIDEIAA